MSKSGLSLATTFLYRAKNVTEAWEFWYGELASQHKSQDSRDGGVVGECINAITVIEDPTRNIVKSDIRKMPMRYAIGELLWYLSGNNNLSEISKFASTAWARMSDDGITVNSNYGHKIQHFYGFDQFEYIERLLREDPNTRQAVVHIKDPRDVLENPTKDVPCTLTLQFLIRDNKLHMTTVMRSNDIWMGFPYDVFQFTCMQILLSMKLGVEIGTYTHIAGSLHLYERNLVKDENADGKTKASNQG